MTTSATFKAMAHKRAGYADIAIGGTVIKRICVAKYADGRHEIPLVILNFYPDEPSLKATRENKGKAI